MTPRRPDAAGDGEPASDINLAGVLDALTIALVFQDHRGQQAIANSAAHRLLGLDSATSSPAKIMAALASMVGAAPNPPGPKEFDVEREGRLYQIVIRVVHGAIGPGLLWRLEDVTEDRRRRSQLAEAKRRVLMADVAGGVGHQFNNLLARLICQAEAIQDATSVGQVYTLAEEIIRTAEAGALTVRRLMTYAGGAKADCRNIELMPLVEHWKNGRMNGALAINVENCGGTVFADHDLLRASLDELHANAVEASATALELRCSRENADTLVLEVVDDGHGMRPEDCARATDPFFTRNEVGDGAGLGLSMVQGAMRLCGGGLDIVSHPGKGTTVKLILARGKGQE